MYFGFHVKMTLKSFGGHFWKILVVRSFLFYNHQPSYTALMKTSLWRLSDGNSAPLSFNLCAKWSSWFGDLWKFWNLEDFRSWLFLDSEDFGIVWSLRGTLSFLLCERGGIVKISEGHTSTFLFSFTNCIYLYLFISFFIFSMMKFGYTTLSLLIC